MAAARHEEGEAADCGEHVVAVEDQVLAWGSGAKLCFEGEVEADEARGLI